VKRKPPAALVRPEAIQEKILFIRGEKVLLDESLARMYGVGTKTLNQAVKRNAQRFPSDFMFQLTAEEVKALKSQSVTSNMGRGGRRSAPNVFTEQGVAMLSSVLRSERAVRVNIEIVRAFVRLRRLLATHADLAQRIEELERKFDGQFAIVFDAIRALMEPPEDDEAKRPRIGFKPSEAPESGRGRSRRVGRSRAQVGA
jgi:hypothetical protein